MKKALLIGLVILVTASVIGAVIVYLRFSEQEKQADKAMAEFIQSVGTVCIPNLDETYKTHLSYYQAIPWLDPKTKMMSQGQLAELKDKNSAFCWRSFEEKTRAFKLAEGLHDELCIDPRNRDRSREQLRIPDARPLDDQEYSFIFKGQFYLVSDYDREIRQAVAAQAEKERPELFATGVQLPSEYYRWVEDASVALCLKTQLEAWGAQEFFTSSSFNMRNHFNQWVYVHYEQIRFTELMPEVNYVSEAQSGLEERIDSEEKFRKKTWEMVIKSPFFFSPGFKGTDPKKWKNICELKGAGAVPGELDKFYFDSWCEMWLQDRDIIKNKLLPKHQDPRSPYRGTWEYKFFPRNAAVRSLKLPYLDIFIPGMYLTLIDRRLEGFGMDMEDLGLTEAKLVDLLQGAYNHRATYFSRHMRFLRKYEGEGDHVMAMLREKDYRIAYRLIGGRFEALSKRQDVLSEVVRE
jgi:hypothetical protein